VIEITVRTAHYFAPEGSIQRIEHFFQNHENPKENELKVETK
jgi:hypothetical protein